MFPRGKVDEQEEDVACAIREVREEIGVDISKMINGNVRNTHRGKQGRVLRKGDCTKTIADYHLLPFSPSGFH